MYRYIVKSLTTLSEGAIASTPENAEGGDNVCLFIKARSSTVAK